MINLNHRTILSLLLFVTLFAGSVTAQDIVKEETKEREYTGQWILQLDPSVDQQATLSQLGYEVVSNTALPNFVIIDIPDTTLAPQAQITSQAEQLAAQPGVITADPVFIMEIELMNTPTDPLYPDQWHLNNTGQSGGTAGEDANLLGAWNLPTSWPTSGYSGVGVTIGIADDGLQYTHPDLDNFDATRSYNYNNNTTDPAPISSNDAHGTSVAGVAAADDDSKCGVGAAFDATLAGQRFFGSNTITNVMIGDVLGNTQASNPELDISNNSWGYSGGAITFDNYQRFMVEDRINNGRGGLGQIYVFANGNGLQAGSWSTRSEFNSSRYTIAVAATDHNGVQSFYSENGANIVVNAPSNGSSAGITTTDLLGSSGYGGLTDPDCTNGFGGTSSAAPLVSGIVALMLEANPNLTWRDVQHILINTADQNDPTNASWTTNGNGYLTSESYGFGRVDAAQAVTTAAFWNSIPTETIETSGVQSVNTAVPDAGAPVISNYTFTSPSISSLEHVTVRVNIATTFRGDLELLLTSPSGTISTLMTAQFDPDNNFVNFPFSTPHFWGEDPQGTWTVSVRDALSGDLMTFNDYEIILYGSTTSDAPRYADLELTQAVSAATVYSGSDYQHTLTVNNLNNGATDGGFSVDVTLPADVVFNGATVSNGGVCSGTMPQITCSWTTASFTTATATLDLTASLSRTAGVVTSSATATLNSANDLNTVNNVYIEQDTTFAVPDINGDGIVSAEDAIYIINRLGGTDAVADLDGNSLVEVSDLQIVINAFGLGS